MCEWGANGHYLVKWVVGVDFAGVGASAAWVEFKESAMSDFRVGVIGAGGIAAKLHLPEMQAVDDAKVVV